MSLLIVFIFCSDGNILDLGRDVEIENRYAKSSFDRVLDVRGKTIVPGMVDAHSHPVWAGDRVHEFALKVIPNAVHIKEFCLIRSIMIFPFLGSFYKTL